MSEDGKSPVERIAALETENLLRRQSEAAQMLIFKEIYDLSKKTASQTENIERMLTDHGGRFQDHEERITDLEDFRTSHSAVRVFASSVLGGLITLLGAAGVYFAAFWHPVVK